MSWPALLWPLTRLFVTSLNNPICWEAQGVGPSSLLGQVKLLDIVPFGSQWFFSQWYNLGWNCFHSVKQFQTDWSIPKANWSSTWGPDCCFPVLRLGASTNQILVLWQPQFASMLIKMCKSRWLKEKEKKKKKTKRELGGKSREGPWDAQISCSLMLTLSDVLDALRDCSRRSNL